MNMKTNILRGLKYLAILVVAFISLVLVINLSIFDEELKPEVHSMLEKEKIIIEHDNAYVALWGITADNRSNFIEAGIKLMERYQKINEASEYAVISDSDERKILGKRNLDVTWKEHYQSCRSRTKSGCLREVSEFLKTNPIIDSRLKIMLKRYSEIVKMTKYQSIMTLKVESPLQSYSEIMRLGQIRTSSVYLKKNTMNTLTTIEEELIFWRMLLKNSEDLINKMVSIASLWKNYSYLSEIIKTEKLSPKEKIKLQGMLSEFTKEELDLSVVFHSEIKASMLVVIDSMTRKTSDAKSGILSTFTTSFWQKNATLNLAYDKNLLPLICLSKLDSKSFYQFKEKQNVYCGFPSEEDRENFSLSLYNPVGKILMEIALPAYPTYIARVHDLNGVISLVKLQLELKSVAEKDLEEAINNSEIRNLYTGEPMKYNKEKNVISFKCLDKSSECKINL